MEKEVLSRSKSHRLQLLEQLVDELLKDQGDEQKIKSLMESVGLDYSTDQIRRMNSVLHALHPEK